MVLFINQSGTIGQIVTLMTNQGTGSLFLTFLLIVLSIMLLAMVFRIPLEFTAIIILPITLTLMSFIGNFWTFGGVLLIYLAILGAKYFFFYR